MSDYGYSVEVVEGYDEAVVRTRLAFRGEGFSIVTEAHVGGMLGPEAGSDRQYLIMGMWNATASEKRIGSDLQVALHLPCNLVIHETGSSALVAALDPAEGYEGDERVTEELVDAARDALVRVLQKVATPA